MKPSRHHVPIDPVEYRVYASASQRLRKRMGAAAPTPAMLIQHELSRRRPAALVEEYLYFIGWYDPKPPSRIRRDKPAQTDRVRPKVPPRIIRQIPLVPPSGDPSRN
jgi:hypothetical protein